MIRDESAPAVVEHRPGGKSRIGLLLKGLIAVVFPAGGIFIYLLVTQQLFSRTVWRRLHVFTGALILLAIAAPWHVLAALTHASIF